MKAIVDLPSTPSINKNCQSASEENLLDNEYSPWPWSKEMQSHNPSFYTLIYRGFSKSITLSAAAEVS